MTKKPEWEDEFDKKFTVGAAIRTGGKVVCNWINPQLYPSDIKDFIRNLLAEQEQRHKNELDETIKSIARAHVGGDFTQFKFMGLELKELVELINGEFMERHRLKQRHKKQMDAVMLGRSGLYNFLKTDNGKFDSNLASICEQIIEYQRQRLEEAK